MPLLSSANVEAEVMRYVARNEVISDECARTIASHWMAPGTCLSAFVHHFEVSIVEFWQEVNQESIVNGSPRDLCALVDWIEQLTINLGRDI